MEQNVISISEALKIMSLKDEKGMYKPFDISFRTFNEQTKQGGKLKTYKGAKYLPEALDTKKQIRSTNHFENRTRNIEVAPDELKKVRIDFIISINNLKVIY